MTIPSVVLSNPFDQNQFTGFIKDFLPDFRIDERKIDVAKSGFSSITRLGESDTLVTSVLVIRSSKSLDSRITLTNNSFKILKTYNIYRALIVYVNEDDSIWRLSLLTALPTFDSSGKVVISYSNPERHSYVLGSDVGVATARKYLLNMGRVSDFDDLRFRFSIEAINKEFYNAIANFFYDLIGTYDSDAKFLKKPLLLLPGKASHLENQEYAIRLFGRLIFCWFLREKKSRANVQLLQSEVFDGGLENKTSILREVLEPLFFECLNKPLADRTEKYTGDKFALIPYLNGGLFYPNEGSGGDYYPAPKGTRGVEIPNSWFINLFETLKTYNFTIDENLDFDVELSIDPEMLGRIFENLLAEINPETGESARKTTGSFYTPRRIVSHMTDMCLTQYLLNETTISENKIKALMTIDTLDDLEYPLNISERNLLVEKLYSLKSLDPACGSGAFPIGLLQKMVYLLEQLDSDYEISKEKFGKSFFSGKAHLAENKNYLRKLVLIRDVIHGVDIQPVAVEISKLRCFLTLIVEQEVIDDLENRGLEPLPNLDFQFVCGNSLIGLDEQKQMIFGEDSHLEEELDLIREEFYSTNSSRRREALKSKYLKLVNEELTLFGESSRTSQLKSFQPFVVNNQASFFDPKTMLGVAEFHIVIGNPPYVKLEHLEKTVIASLQAQYFELKNGSKKSWADDLYVHFIFKAFELTSEKGLVCFITNDSFIGLESKLRVRDKLLTENLIELINCPKETFGATIYTAIFLASNTDSIYEEYIASRFSYPEFELEDVNRVRKSYVLEMPNQRLVAQENVLVSKLLTKSKFVDFLKIIDGGIHTGNVRDKIFFRNESNKAKDRLLQGKQIQRWNVWWDAPSAKYRYLNAGYKPTDTFGIGRGGKSSKLKEYWSMHDPAIHFLPDRLLMRQTSDTLFVAYQNLKDDGQFYTDNTLFTISLSGNLGSLRYFLALLNSRLINYVYRYLSMEEGKIHAQVKTSLVEEVPLVFDASREKEVVKIVDVIIRKRRLNPGCDVSEYEIQLDSLVCDIYGLDEFEKKQIMGASI
jgi:adenine-specific DNA-methyltransferase